MTQVRVALTAPAQTASGENENDLAPESAMKTPNSHTLLLAAAIALGAVLAIAWGGFAVGGHGAQAPAAQPSAYSIPF